MRILHISHTGLPDARVEKSALSMKKRGHELIFLGGRPTLYQNLNAFDKVLYLSIGNDLDVAVNPIMKRRWLQAIDRIAPDLVHAHNLIAGHFLLTTDYPVVYDDHEYWSKQLFNYRLRKMPRGLASRPLIIRIPKWESEMLRKYPTITVSENIALDHRERCSWVGVTWNVPTLSEVEWLPTDTQRHGLVYMGNDFNQPRFGPHRNMLGLQNILEFDIISGLSYRDMMLTLTKYKIGLTPWLQHWLHEYNGANKNFEYLHAGLQVVVNPMVKAPFANNDYVHAFNDYSDIAEVVESIEPRTPAEIMRDARAQYIWENQEQVIMDAYKKA